jgi:hypothetical protein
VRVEECESPPPAPYFTRAPRPLRHVPRRLKTVFFRTLRHVPRRVSATCRGGRVGPVGAGEQRVYLTLGEAGGAVGVGMCGGVGVGMQRQRGAWGASRASHRPIQRLYTLLQTMVAAKASAVKQVGYIVQTMVAAKASAVLYTTDHGCCCF